MQVCAQLGGRRLELPRRSRLVSLVSALEHADTYLDLRVVGYGRLAIDSRNCNVEGAILILCHLVRVAIPVIFVSSVVCFLVERASY